MVTKYRKNVVGRFATKRRLNRYVLATIAFSAGTVIGVAAYPVGSRLDNLFSAPTVQPSPRMQQHTDEGSPFDLVMLGDSVTDHGRWSELLPYRVANRGIGRDTVAMAGSRASKLPEGPILIMLGINDLRRGRTVPEIISDYEELLRQVSNKNVYIQSVLGPKELLVEDLNEELKKLAKTS